MFLITDKIAIIISILSFAIFSFGLAGIYLFLNSIVNSSLFFQKANNTMGAKDSEETSILSLIHI